MKVVYSRSRFLGVVVVIRAKHLAWDWPEGYRSSRGSQGISSLFSKDSGLEAFSRNPALDSFAELPGQATALPTMWPNGSSRTELDYCRDNALISRVKLTCLTTV